MNCEANTVASLTMHAAPAVLVDARAGVEVVGSDVVDGPDAERRTITERPASRGRLSIQ